MGSKDWQGTSLFLSNRTIKVARGSFKSSAEGFHCAMDDLEGFLWLLIYETDFHVHEEQNLPEEFAQMGKDIVKYGASHPIDATNNFHQLVDLLFEATPRRADCKFPWGPCRKLFEAARDQEGALARFTRHLDPNVGFDKWLRDNPDKAQELTVLTLKCYGKYLLALSKLLSDEWRANSSVPPRPKKQQEPGVAEPARALFNDTEMQRYPRRPDRAGERAVCDSEMTEGETV